MAIGNIIVIFLLIYYTFYFISFLFRDKRKGIQERNTQLNELRKIPIKTLDEQKKFLNLQTPHTKWKFSWKSIPIIIWFIGLSIIFYKVYSLLLGDIVIPIYVSILVVIVVPIIINLILKQFKLEQNDISVFFRGAK